MNRRRGKRIAWWMGGVGLVVVLACGVAFKDRAVEEYWLWKLESEDVEEQRDAAERLAEMGSVRAVPVMLDKLRGVPWDDSWDQDPLEFVVLDSIHVSSSTGITAVDLTLDGTSSRPGTDTVGPGLTPFNTATAHTLVLTNFVPVAADETFLIEALWKITVNPGRPCVSYWADALRDERRHVRYLGATFLGALGREARDAVVPLLEALDVSRKEGGRGVGLCIQILSALGKVGPEARTAIPAITACLQDKDEAVRRAAAEALTNIQRHEEPKR